MPHSNDKNAKPASAASSAQQTGKIWLTIVGIGEDGVGGLGEAAREAITQAAYVFGGKRHLALAASLITGAAHPWPTPFDGTMSAITPLRDTRKNVCVLASGDPFWYGVGVTLSHYVAASEMRVYPAPSAFSLAAARMAWPLQKVTCLSLHTAPIDTLKRRLRPGRFFLLLTSGADAPAKIAQLLDQETFGASPFTLLEALGGPFERITTHSAGDFARAMTGTEINPLNVVAIETCNDVDQGITSSALSTGPVQSYVQPPLLPLTPGLPDACFANDGQLTRHDCRALTLSALAPHPRELLWDIGAGSGSIAIEWSRAHPTLRAIAVEQHKDRAARISYNANEFGLPDLDVITGAAPDALRDLEPPDAIFIGGGGTAQGVMEAAMAALKPGGRLVANGVTIQMQTKLMALHQQHGGRLIQFAISEAAPLGSMTTWRPALPITQWTWSKSGTKEGGGS